MTYTQWKQQRLKGSTLQAVGQIATVSTSKDPAEQSMTYSQWMKQRSNTKTPLRQDSTATEDTQAQRQEDTQAQRQEDTQAQRQEDTRTQRQKELDRLSAVANPKSASYDPDFINKSSYVSTKLEQNIPSYFDVPARNFYTGDAGEMDTGYSDITYEFINGNVDISEYIVGLGHNYSQISEDEKRLYNYYHTIDRENGTNIANDYLELIQEDLNRRAAEDAFDEYEGKPLKELAFAAKSGIHDFGVSTTNWYIQKDGYIAPTETQVLSEMIREDLADNSMPMWYNAKTGKWEQQILGQSAAQLLYDVIETTSNTAPSLLATAAVGIVNPVLGKIVGNALLFGSAGGNGYQQKINEGYTQTQANTYGVLIGASEIVLEHLMEGFDDLGQLTLKAITRNLGLVDDILAKVAKSAGGKVILNGLSEGREEMLQSFLEPYLAYVVTGEDVTHDWQESLYSGLLGFITGDLFESGTVAVNTAINSDIWGHTGPMSLEEYTLLTQEEALGSDQADPTATSSSPLPGVEGDGAIADATTADPSLSSQTNSQPETAISGEDISTPTTRQALELAIENMHKRPMDPKTYNALFSYNNTLQHANTTQKLLDQKQDILQQQKASNASDAEIQRTQADIAKLEDILAQQEQKLSQAEEDPILQAAAEKASAEIVENRRKNDVDISRTFDRIKAEGNIITDGSHIEKGKLKPNVTYQTGEHEYIYQTNSDGLIERVYVEDLQQKTHDGRLEHNKNTYGKQKGDHAGHLIGDRFGGSPEVDNLVSQAALVNLSSYKKLENQWAKAKNANQTVSVSISINYEAGSPRPVSFVVEYTIDGIYQKVDIDNR